MTTPSFPTIWYWVVGDTNPTTQVFESLSGTFVSNGLAAYQSWVANGGQLYNPSSGAKQIKVTGAINNGAGLIRLTVDTTGQMTTNDAWVVQNVGGTTEANGTWQITVINATTVDLQGSAFVHAFTSNGVIDRGTVIDTATHLYSVLNSLGLSLLPTPSGFYSKNVLLINSNTTLTNPLSEVTAVTNNGGVVDLILPPMNAPNSVPIGFAFYIVNNNASTGNIRVMTNDDATLIFAIRPGYVGTFVNTDNSTVNGSVSLINLSLAQGAQWQIAQGGTGQPSLTNGGTIFGQGIQPLNATAVGTFGQEYRQAGGAPTWVGPAALLTDATGGFPTNAATGLVYVLLSLSAPRTRHLPTANTLPNGARIVVCDPAGGASATNTLTVDLTTATDKLNGVVNGSVVAINQAEGWAAFVTDGVAAWSQVDTNRIPNEAAMLGDLLATNIAAPSTPAAGTTRVYVDSTSKNIAAKNDAGTVNHGVQTKAAVAHNFLTAIADDGSSTLARPASADLSDLPIPLSSGGTGAAKNNYINVGLSGTGQSIPSGGGGTVIIFDTKISDADSVFTLASGKYIPNVAGNYLVTVGTQWNASLGDGTVFGAAVFKNGSEFAFSLNLAGAAAANASQNAVAIVPMNGTTDFIQAAAFQNSGGNVNLGVTTTRTFMQAQRLPS